MHFYLVIFIIKYISSVIFVLSLNVLSLFAEKCKYKVRFLRTVKYVMHALVINLKYLPN